MSIIEASVKMFVRELKTKNPEAKINDKMSVGSFLAEMKDEPDILVGFTIFLAEEFLKNAEGLDDDENPNSNKISNNLIQPENNPGADADFANNRLLKTRIDQMKVKYGLTNKANFDMDNFQSD